MKLNATKIVAGAILGLDFKVVVIADKAYTIHPPTIAKIAGASYYLADLDKGENFKDVLHLLCNAGNATKALSMLINGDLSLSGELSNGTIDEITSAIEEALSLISVENFIRLSLLAKNVQKMVAKQM